MVKKKKEEKALKPEIEERQTEQNIDKNQLIEIAQNIEKSTETHSIADNTSSDTFYRNVVNNLFDKKNISTKTEYLNVRENFMGAKLSFLGKYCNVPFMKNFIEEFEVKRVSLERKGRKEILMALQERRQEMDAQKTQNLSRLFGI